MRTGNALLAATIVAIPAIAYADDPAPEPVAPVSVSAQPAVQPQPGATAPRDYGRWGQMELGASAGLMFASNMRDVNVSPTLGYFMSDNFELSGILSVSNVKAGTESSSVWSALVEPSFHFAMDRSMFVFVGVGLGAAYIQPLGTALAVAPRAGLNFLVGKSGVLTPSLSYEYTMHDTMGAAGTDGTTDVTLLAATSTLRANIGYSVAW
jgi:hypothetical protein